MGGHPSKDTRAPGALRAQIMLGTWEATQSRAVYSCSASHFHTAFPGPCHQ